MSVVYFGDPWPAPALDEGIRVGTPVGATCLYCGEAITRSDRGFIQPGVKKDNDDLVGFVAHVHAECQLDQTCGHVVGICRCTGYESGRARARKVWDAFYNDEKGQPRWPTPTTP